MQLTRADLKVYMDTYWVTFASETVDGKRLSLKYLGKLTGAMFMVEHGSRRMYFGPYEFVAISTYNHISGRGKIEP